ncbi:unnamed protein product [Nezara viridula]|uniref:Uncharacterized protein n=1 Tax=Nezara viridula TaxID=85310 RepID=A0A9P0MWB0_NEZVI|nr:unnamed protein product [Nezara viridula]
MNLQKDCRCRRKIDFDKPSDPLNGGHGRVEGITGMTQDKHRDRADVLIRDTQHITPPPPLQHSSYSQDTSPGTHYPLIFSATKDVVRKLKGAYFQRTISKLSSRDKAGPDVRTLLLQNCHVQDISRASETPKLEAQRRRPPPLCSELNSIVPGAVHGYHRILAGPLGRIGNGEASPQYKKEGSILEMSKSSDEGAKGFPDCTSSRNPCLGNMGTCYIDPAGLGPCLGASSHDDGSRVTTADEQGVSSSYGSK